jgi:hypothetical protein
LIQPYFAYGSTDKAMFSFFVSDVFDLFLQEIVDLLRGILQRQENELPLLKKLYCLKSSTIELNWHLRWCRFISDLIFPIVVMCDY